MLSGREFWRDGMPEQENAARVPLILRDLPEQVVGERVIVRPYRPGDGQAVWEAIEEARETLKPWMPWVDKHRSPADSEEFVRRSHGNWHLRQDLIVGVWERESRAFLGGSGLHPKDPDLPSYEIGYWLRPSAVGRGLMTEAVRLLCGLAFETLGANRVFIRCDARNERSAAIARRLGFVLEGTFRNDARDTSGALRDTMWFGMLPEEFRRLQNGGSQPLA
jgi:RimJ/RimL family protein N-acetyltransferase